jgi:hypothetical protein
MIQDLASVLPELQRNLDSSLGVGSAVVSEWTPVQACPLSWGDVSSAFAVLEICGKEWGAHSDGRGPLCNLIVAADVVYHEHLIDPLLDTLVVLTDHGHGFVDPLTSLPPLVTVSYVQRFKRAKAFIKKARKHFHVGILQVDDVVDYDTLNWNRGSDRLVVNSGSSNWKEFQRFSSSPLDGSPTGLVESDVSTGDAPVSCLAYHYILRRKEKTE